MKPKHAMMNHKKLTILQINDTHGYLESHPELFWQGDKAEYRNSGGYVKRCLGLILYVKFENPAGARIQQIFTGDEELQRKETYTAAFVTTQGVPKKYGRNRGVLELRAIDALKHYCAAHPCVNADLRGTVIAVCPSEAGMKTDGNLAVKLLHSSQGIPSME